jgi:hypothetical protein
VAFTLLVVAPLDPVRCFAALLYVQQKQHCWDDGIPALAREIKSHHYDVSVAEEPVREELPPLCDSTRPLELKRGADVKTLQNVTLLVLVTLYVVDSADQV